MSVIRPRSVVHRGYVEACGLLIDKTLRPLAQVRAQILAAHQPGTVVHDLGHHYALIWPTPRRVVARESLGEALIRVGEAGLSACPLAPHEQPELGPEAIAYAEAGALQQVTPSPSTQVDLGTWLDLGSYTRAEVQHLGTPPHPIEAAEIPPADAEALLADARPDLDPEQASVIEALRRHAAERAEARRSTARRTKTGEGSQAAEPGPLARLWRKVSETLLRQGPLARAIGRRHAQYLLETMALFERGDLDDALRRAIPASLLGDSLPKPPAITTPSPRSSLDIRPEVTRATTSMHMPPDMFTHMRELYAHAATQLEAKGRIQEAAFVYFELLHDALAGVALLERHDQHALAAELAEARELAPALVVRLWFLAKQPARAILVARRTRSFATAVAELNRSRPDLAAALRRLWAEHERASGDYVAAIEALWPSTDDRARTLPWIDRALAYVGPATRAKLIIHRLALEPSSLVQVHEQIQAELADPGSDALTLRIELARQLGAHKRPPAHQALARVVARSLLHDFGRDRDLEVHTTLATLLGHAIDPLLRADLPPITRAEPSPTLLERPSALERQLPAAERGALSAWDVAVLADGGALIALGEAGVLQLRKDGRIRQHYNVPADALVVSPTSSIALALARRDAFVQVWQLDTSSRSARWWQDLKLEAWAARHDRGQWFVAERHALVAVDLLATTAKSLWRLPMMDVQVEAIHVGNHKLRVLMNHELGPELFHYTLPELVLRHREQLAEQLIGRPRWPPMLGPDLLAYADADHEALHVHDDGRAWPIPGADLEPRAASAEWLAVSQRFEDSVALQLRRRRDQALGLELMAPEATWIRCAIAGETLWGIDDLRRAWSVSLRDGTARVVPLR